MCNYETMDSIRAQVEKLVVHAGDLRERFGVADEEFREGSLSPDALAELNQAIHHIEKDAAAFETLVET